MTIHAFIEKVGRKIKFWIRYIYELYFAHGLYKYSSYEEYVRVQTVTNLQKEDWIWTSEKNIGPLGEYIRKMIPDSKFGICHGVRNGTELEWFAKYTGAKVIGTEISPSANKYKNVIQWDFHEPNPEWVGKADFVYTNALDHAYNPEKAVDIDVIVTEKKDVPVLKKIAGFANKELHGLVIPDLTEISSALKGEIIKKHLILKGTESVLRWMLWQQSNGV